jgi:hypothetical protein
MLSTGVIVAVFGPATLRVAGYHPLYIHTAQVARRLNMPRRAGENLCDWDLRVVIAERELNSATDEFIRAALLKGRRHSPPGSKDYELHLPADHPAALRYQRAKGLLPRKIDRDLN